ncbi:MAG: hypothetical protein AB1716_10595, partial [Planctomycetota bacterium]
GTTTTTLDTASASIRIQQTAGAAQASATASFTDARGRALRLTGDQFVRVSGVDLVGPGADNRYSATVTAAPEYTVTVREPTRGVEETRIDAPAAFTITAPSVGGGAALSGFTLMWTGANTQLEIEITLSQTLFGTVEQATYGPFPDTGARTFTAEDLQRFRQGAELTVTVNKLNTLDDVGGFASGTLAAGVAVSQALTPTP